MAIVTEPQGGEGGVWITVTELARLKGVSKQTIAEKVNRLESEGRLTTRREGKKRLVELAAFDFAVGQVGDAFKELAVETGRGFRSDASAAGLRDAQTDRARYDAQLKALELAERKGLVVPLRGEHGLETGLATVAELIVRDLGAPMDWVGVIMQAANLGENAVRTLLREKIREQRAAIAQSLMKLAGDANDATADGFEIDLSLEEEP